MISSSDCIRDNNDPLPGRKRHPKDHVPAYNNNNKRNNVCDTTPTKHHNYNDPLPGKKRQLRSPTSVALDRFPRTSDYVLEPSTLDEEVMDTTVPTSSHQSAAAAAVITNELPIPKQISKFQTTFWRVMAVVGIQVCMGTVVNAISLFPTYAGNEMAMCQLGAGKATWLLIIPVLFTIGFWTVVALFIANNLLSIVKTTLVHPKLGGIQVQLFNVQSLEHIKQNTYSTEVLFVNTAQYQINEVVYQYHNESSTSLASSVYDDSDHDDDDDDDPTCWTHPRYPQLAIGSDQTFAREPRCIQIGLMLGVAVMGQSTQLVLEMMCLASPLWSCIVTSIILPWFVILVVLGKCFRGKEVDAIYNILREEEKIQNTQDSNMDIAYQPPFPSVVVNDDGIELDCATTYVRPSTPVLGTGGTEEMPPNAPAPAAIKTEEVPSPSPPASVIAPVTVNIAKEATTTAPAPALPTVNNEGLSPCPASVQAIVFSDDGVEIDWGIFDQRRQTVLVPVVKDEETSDVGKEEEKKEVPQSQADCSDTASNSNTLPEIV